MNTKETFAEEGLRPVGLKPPADVVRAYLPGGRRLGEYVLLTLWMLLGIVAALMVACWSPSPLQWLSLVVLVGFAANTYVAIGEDYGVFELEGDLLRATHLYTGLTIERHISQVEELRTIAIAPISPEALVVAALLGRVKGVEIRFRGERSGWRVLRSDPEMIGALELLEGVMYRMSEIGPLRTEISDDPGRPLVRRVTWRRSAATDSATLKPETPRRIDRGVLLACLNILGMMFGVILCISAAQESERRRIGLMPAIEIPLDKLLAEGVGENRHVKLTQFEPGGFRVDERYGRWNQVWVALFPKDAERTEIRMVFSSNTISDVVMLRDRLGGAAVTGICSAAPQTGWGPTLGPILVENNRGLPLNAAWELEELRSPPTAESVLGAKVAAALAFVWVLVVSGLIFRP